MDTEGIRVLLIEDYPIDAELVRDVLRSTPEIYLETVDLLSSAIKYTQSNSVDVVLADLGLPDSQGLDTLRTLLKNAPHIPVVVLTGYEDYALSRNAIGLGAQDYLVKPVMNGPSLARILRYAVERKRADRLLRNSETMYRRLHESMMDGFVRVDMQGHIVDANSTFQKMLGYSDDELRSLTYFQLTPERWHPFEAEIVARQIIPHGYSEVYEKEYYRKDGKLLPVELRTSLLRDESGTPATMWAIVRDLSERKALENSLRTSEARLSNALKMALLGHWEYNAYTDLFTFNDQFYNVLRTTSEKEGGYTKTSAQYVERFVHPDDRSMVMKYFQKNLKTVGDRHFDQLEHRMLYENGQSGYTSVRFFIVKDAQSSRVTTYGVNQDITERKRAERKLQNKNAQYQLIANNTTDFIWLYDLDMDRFIYVSPSVEKLRGFKVGEALSQSLQTVLTPASYRIIKENLPKRVAAFEAGDDSVRTRTDEVGLTRKDGSIVTTEMVTTLICDKHNHVSQLQGITRDITERKSLQTQLLQAQKMEAIGRLAGGIAHDFNNLLTIILGYSQSLIDSFSKNDSVREELEHIRNAGNRATALTSMLLAFSRKQILQPKVIDLKPLIQESLKLIRRLIGEDIELITDLASDLGHVKVDSVQMNQVIMNLIINSRDAMPLGGKLIIKARNVRLENDNASANAGFCKGEYVMLAISDTGMGMDSEIKSHIFEPFFTTKAIGKGTGLGLATVYGIINQSGGSITVDSEPKRGATFTIYLPIVDRAEESIESCEVMTVNGSETILLVEDDNGVRKLASLYLRAKGYTVLEADNGPNALRIAEEYGGAIHLLITDMIMPGGMNGIELINAVQRFNPNIGTLIVTGYIGELTIGAQSPDSSILQKPFTADDLTRRVWAVLQERKAQECQTGKLPKHEFSIQSPDYCI